MDVMLFFVPVQEVDMSNTPGALYAIAYIISAVVYILTNPRCYHNKKHIFWNGLLGVFLVLFMSATHLISVYLFLPCVAVDFCIIAAMIGLSCELTFRNVIYTAVRAFLLGELAASLGWQIFYFAVVFEGIPLNLLTQSICVILVYGLVFVVSYRMERYLNRENYHIHIEKFELAMVLLGGVLVYAFSNLSYLRIVSPFTTSNVQDIFIIRTIADAAGVGIFTAYHVLLINIKKQADSQQIERLLQMQYNNYRVSQESIELVNQKYHDLKHQIHLLRSEFSSAQATSYLDKMEDEIRAYEADNKTGNQVLDIILTTNSLKCQKLGIEMTCVVDGVALNFMHPMDISSLFGNALDNAIEAVDKVTDLQKRLIHMSVSQEKGFVRIKIENRYEGEVKFRGGKPQTTKQDHKNHGFGVRSMEKIVRDYKGSMTIVAEDGWFELRILLPMAT